VKNEGMEAAAGFVFDESRKLSLLYRRLETCGKPWVCAINGTAMGGGFELALACHQRIASENPKTRLSLPEIKIGLFPGAGGTQRIARMLQPADALQFLLKGDQLNLDRAKAMKLVDAVVPAADLVKTAKEWIKAGGKAVKPWDEKGFKNPGGPVYSKAGMMTFPPANAIYRRETYDNYPAARAILQVVYEGLQLDMDTALRVESRWFAKIVRSPEAAAMIRTLFVSMQDLNKGARRPAKEPATNLKKIGVVGAGFMGAGIAQVSAAAGLQVVLIDRDQETADKGKAALRKALSDRVMKGRMKGAARDELLAFITPTADYGALKDCDLIIEAVFEDRKIKADVIAKVQAVIGDKTIFASNTSTLPITSLATEFKDQSRFIGIHFFSPVDRMMLVEIILGKSTGDRPRSITCARSARRRSSSTTAAASTPTAACSITSRKATSCCWKAFRRRWSKTRRAWPACRSGRCRSTTRPHSTSASRFCAPPKAILAKASSRRRRRNCSRTWSRKTAAWAARTARAFMIIRKGRRSGCGPAFPICCRRSSAAKRSRRSTSRNSSSASW
jgi:3-hydroxyacyl-CoA dehydrogenase/enoyl-CoA hydratase/3-hydroxybutyryl-CoA epimerase